MTSEEKGRSRKTPNLRTERGEVVLFCGRHIWKPPRESHYNDDEEYRAPTTHEYLKWAAVVRLSPHKARRSPDGRDRGEGRKEGRKEGPKER